MLLKSSFGQESDLKAPWDLSFLKKRWTLLTPGNAKWKARRLLSNSSAMFMQDRAPIHSQTLCELSWMKVIPNFGFECRTI